MLRLETVEDFERVDRALGDPNSKLHEYCMVDYGYCGFCTSISAFDRILEPHHIRCRGCGNSFYPDHMGLSFLFYTGEKEARRVYEFMLGTMPEPRTRKERKFFSGENQRKLFNQLLEFRIRELKREQRVLGGKVRRLAKLRP